MSNREQIADFLAQGFSQADTARFCGISAPTVSDYMKDDTFKELLRDKAIKHLDARVKNKYDLLEEKTLDGLIGAVRDFADVNDMVRVLESIAKIKRSNIVPAHTFQNPTLGVLVVMPQQQIPQVVMNEDRQVVAIGDKSLAPMPSSNVQKLFKMLSEGSLPSNLGETYEHSASA